MQPTAYRILAERIEEENKTTSGLLLATKKKKPALAKVLSVGTNIENIKPNQTVVYQAYSEDAVTIDNKEYIFLREDDIQGIVEW